MCTYLRNPPFGCLFFLSQLSYNLIVIPRNRSSQNEAYVPEGLALINLCLPFDHYLEEVLIVFEIFPLDQILQKAAKLKLDRYRNLGEHKVAQACFYVIA